VDAGEVAAIAQHSMGWRGGQTARSAPTALQTPFTGGIFTPALLMLVESVCCSLIVKASLSAA
jgi:hypothetical protein